MAFLFIAAVGKIAGKIEPDTRGRVLCAVLGLILVPGGIVIHGLREQPPGPAVGGTGGARPASTTGCKPGYVRRLAVPDDLVCVTPETRTKIAMDNELAPSRTRNGGPYGADTCLEGIVWREAVPEDHICVSPDTRAATRQDNASAETRRAPRGGLDNAMASRRAGVALFLVPSRVYYCSYEIAHDRCDFRRVHSP
jgi:hypothetical protein